MRLTSMILLIVLLLTGCSTSVPPSASDVSTRLTDSIMVIANLSEQLDSWRGTPYRDGGMTKSGIDCSGFIYLTFYDQFAITLPRSTREQIEQGMPVARNHLRPGDLVFFRTGSARNGMHVGIYYKEQKFIHASTSAGVTVSSLTNPYWIKTWLTARRL